jgi:hypothetical protein
MEEGHFVRRSSDATVSTFFDLAVNRAISSRFGVGGSFLLMPTIWLWRGAKRDAFRGLMQHDDVVRSYHNKYSRPRHRWASDLFMDCIRT